MTERAEILAALKADIAELETGPDEFDEVGSVFSLFQHVLALLPSSYDGDRLRGWRDLDDPAFDRFASKLKTTLEDQREYLDGIAGVLEIEGDVVADKIAARRAEIDQLLARKETVLAQGAELFAAESEIRARTARLDELTSRRTALSEMAEALAGRDLNGLASEVDALEADVRRLEADRGPMAEKAARLEADRQSLREALRGLERDMAGLKDAYGREAAELARRVPEWVETLRVRTAEREAKVEGYVGELSDAARAYQDAETRLQDHLKEIRDYTAAIDQRREVLRIHFNADREIGVRFAESLPEMREEVEGLVSRIEADLTRLDETLARMREQIEAVENEIVPLGLSEG